MDGKKTEQSFQCSNFLVIIRTRKRKKWADFEISEKNPTFSDYKLVLVRTHPYFASEAEDERKVFWTRKRKRRKKSGLKGL